MGSSLFTPEWMYPPAAGPDSKRARLPLSKIFKYGATNTPDKIAIHNGKVQYTFSELDKWSSQLARKMRHMAVNRQDRIVVLTEKIPFIAAIIGGIWKLGAVYVPIDSQNPIDRTRKMISDLDARIIIGSAMSLAKLGEKSERHVSFEEIQSQLADDASTAEVECFEIEEQAIAYIIFTSGSTGSPKGVMISHKSLLDYFYNHNQVLQFNASSHVFSMAPYHFDVSIEDTILPLSLGAAVFVFAGMVIGPIVRNLLAKLSISHLIAVSTLLSIITEDGKDIDASRFPRLEMVMTGAEVCDPKIINIWKRGLPNTRLINAYGPTEATIVCMTYSISKIDENRASAYPIGVPLQNIEIAILDGIGGEIKDRHVQGELCVGGSQVMAGYFNNIESTNKVIFYKDGVKYYRTGDICIYDDEHNVVYVGRVDNEVKISGRRIHLDEIKQAILSFTRIESVEVGVYDASYTNKSILAVICAPDGFDLNELKGYLDNTLPAYMIPKAWGLTTKPFIGSTGKSSGLELLKCLKAAYAKKMHPTFKYQGGGEFVAC